MKTFVRVLIVLSLLSLWYLPVKAAFEHYVQGKEVRLYDRFFTDEGFNFHSLHSPFQKEVHTRVEDTTDFSVKVMYPYAEKFKMIAPAGNPEEAVALQVRDSLDAALLEKGTTIFNWDYDNSSAKVRAHKNPKTETTNAHENLSVFGTASPEARKYGLEKSIQIGTLEGENALLAEDRVQRTAEALRDLGYVIDANSIKSAEIQFLNQDEVQGALENPEILNEMRYVKVSTSISSKRTDVETKTVPVLIPLLLLLSILALRRLGKFRFNKIILPKGRDLSWLLYIFYTLVALIIMYILFMYFPWFIVLLALLLALYWIYQLAKLIYQLLRNTKIRPLKIPKWLTWIFKKIIKLFTFIILLPYLLWLWLKKRAQSVTDFFKRHWRIFLVCWHRELSNCWKRVIVIMFIIIMILMGVLMYLLI